MTTGAEVAEDIVQSATEHARRERDLMTPEEAADSAYRTLSIPWTAERMVGVPTSSPDWDTICAAHRRAILADPTRAEWVRRRAEEIRQERTQGVR